MAWVKVEDKVSCDWFYEKTGGLMPTHESSSLHCWEEQFELEEGLYKISGTFTSNDFTVEVWK